MNLEQILSVISLEGKVIQTYAYHTFDLSALNTRYPGLQNQSDSFSGESKLANKSKIFGSVYVLGGKLIQGRREAFEGSFGCEPSSFFLGFYLSSCGLCS